MGQPADRKPHPFVPRLVEDLERGRVGRREFLRTSTLLGLSAAAAYGIVGRVFGPAFVPAARAQEPVKGGVLRYSMAIPQLRNPHRFEALHDANIVRQVNDYLTRTGVDNVTVPWLLEGWEPSDDLRSWTLVLRPDVRWHNGEPLVADHVIWNLEHMLDPAVGSSVLGLMEGFLVTTENGESRIWDANAIEKVNDRTIRLNGQAPQLAVPENLFHYPALMLWPEENGEWGPGSIGTGPFTCETVEVARRVVLKAHPDYWGEGPWLDEVQILDIGQEPAAEIAAFAARQIDGQYEGEIVQFAALQQMPHLAISQVETSQATVARMKVTEKPFDDPRVRKAMRLALDPRKLLQIAHLDIGLPGEHHHVCRIHPEYADVGFWEQDIEGARTLLEEAGMGQGFSTEITCRNDPAFEAACLQVCAQMWQQIGVQVQINVVPVSQFWDIWTQVPFGFTPWTHRPLGVMTLALAYRSGVPWNESGWSNPEFDRLLAQAESTLNVDERRKVMGDLERIMLEDGPIALPFWRGLFSFWDKKVKGFQHHPTSYLFAEEIWIEEA